MSHDHSHDISESGKRLAIVVALNFLITITEVIGGLMSGSLSLLSDALHNFSDGIAVIIAWIAIKLRTLPRSDHYTFGLKRAEVLAAVINAGALVAISIYLFIEAWNRYHSPEPITGSLMTLVATVGLVANIIGTWLLHRGSKESMNLRAAYLHLFSDAISSVGVILGGLAIMFFSVYWIDPLLTILIGLYVLKESMQILWRTLGVFMLAAPPELNMDEIRQVIRKHENIRDVHHIHLWAVAENDIHFEGHIVVDDQMLSQASLLREQLEELLHDQFDINHTTFQFESAVDICKTADLA
ncbi:Cobalt-zinc-cadmium resistance protein CzcD [hydrothermal vent metagenome]|uniref:Cobalt-zinc-cadmium resistance protein CzcD n=1 Tax=hydrothermal vent metagenome TaxID=652676 RepID=A0A3B0XE20_9ZZZZ